MKTFQYFCCKTGFFVFRRLVVWTRELMRNFYVFFDFGLSSLPAVDSCSLLSSSTVHQTNRWSNQRSTEV